MPRWETEGGEGTGEGSVGKQTQWKGWSELVISEMGECWVVTQSGRW